MTIPHPEHHTRTRAHPERIAGIVVEWHESVDSTSVWARRHVVAGGPLPRVFVADRQTGGIGRFRRAWSSPDGGLWCTLAWPIEAPRTRIDAHPGHSGAGVVGGGVLDGLGLRVGLACCAAIDDVLARAGASLVTGLKWPNDVILSGRKVAGILCEVTPAADAAAVAMIGVGINANFRSADLPESLRTRAGTLRDIAGVTIDLLTLLASLTPRLIDALTTPGLSAACVAAARGRLVGAGETATLSFGDGTTIRGVLLGLSDDGRPTLRTDAGDIVTPPGAELLFG